MNAFEDQPDRSDLNKILMAVSLVWIYAILVGAFWWAMVAIPDSRLGAPAVMGAWLWFPVWALSGSVSDVFIRPRYR